MIELLQPLAVRALVDDGALDLLVLDDAALLGVDQEHAARLEAALGAARFDGRSYYRIVAPESGAPIDALLTGTTRAAVEEVPVTEKRKKCTEYDPADKNKVAFGDKPFK